MPCKGTSYDHSFTSSIIVCALTAYLKVFEYMLNLKVETRHPKKKSYQNLHELK